MAHVINRQEPGPLLWATRLHCLEGHLEQWQLWTPGDTQLVVVSHSKMAHIEPSGQLVRWRLAAQPSAPVGLPTQGIAGMTGEAARQLWLFHLEQARSAAHGQMIEQLWQFYAGLPSGGVRQFVQGLLFDKPFIAAFYRGKASHHHHHDYEGGLLEHSVEVALTARMLCQQYQLDSRTADVAFLGGLLHDVGKLYLYYNNSSGEGICSSHEALNFMKLEPYLEPLMAREPRVFEALTACLSASVGKQQIQYMPETIVKMADRLSAEVYHWRRVFVGLPDFYWFHKSDEDARIYKRLG